MPSPFSNPRRSSAKSARLIRRECASALAFLEPYVRPVWLIPQFRHALENNSPSPGEREGLRQVLHVTFPGIRNGVRALLELLIDSLAKKFYETKDPNLKPEIDRLASELVKLDGESTA